MITTLTVLDRQFHELSLQLERLKAQGLAGDDEYCSTLLRLQSVSKARLKSAGIVIKTYR